MPTSLRLGVEGATTSRSARRIWSPALRLARWSLAVELV